MRNSKTPIDVPLSPQDVLVVFQDRYRFQEEFDPDVDSGAMLSFDTPVDKRQSNEMDASMNLLKPMDRLA